jgi:hypothetical protein
MGIIRNIAKKALKVAVIYTSKKVISKIAGKVVEAAANRKAS